MEEPPPLLVGNGLFCRRGEGYGTLRGSTTSLVLAPDGGACVQGKVEVWGSVHLPAALVYTCTRCGAVWSVLVYDRPRGEQVAVFPASLEGGIPTAHTPAGVAFDLDQAPRCHSVRAPSAALTRFRSAPAWLWLDRGFPQNRLGPKLQALDAALGAGKAPQWAGVLDEFLDVVRLPGNAASHPSGGDLAKPNELDRALYRHLETTFVEFVDRIYEDPKRREQRLLELQRPLAKGTV